MAIVNEFMTADTKYENSRSCAQTRWLRSSWNTSVQKLAQSLGLGLAILLLLLAVTPAWGQDAVSGGDDESTQSELVESTESLERVLSAGDSNPSPLTNRLICFGLLGGGFLALLGVLFAYLRLDHATRGFYGGRLQLLALAGAILILVTSYFLWSQVLFK